MLIKIGILAFICGCGSSTTQNVKEETTKNSIANITPVENNDSTDSGKYPTITIEEIKMNVRKGDTNAYNQLAHINLTHPEDQLFWALLMAHKYDYNLAYFDVFSCLLDANLCQGYSMDKVDAKSRKMALDYLLIAAKKGHKQSKEIIKDYFPQLLNKKK